MTSVTREVNATRSVTHLKPTALQESRLLDMLLSEYVQPVCLPVPGRLTTKNGVLSGLKLTVAGWGMTDKST
jgi:hypothetical protein